MFGVAAVYPITQVGLAGVEPAFSEPKSGVIPIYYRAIQTVFNMSMNICRFNTV